ncbi:MAG: phosphatidylserine/phosphatidylglycerophosphate/cardiolipin synthase family protein [Deltaproteobacteria bacterium]|nr:phosphatidylserine/phosphatidylglycerophosphate/cardiolipin synthase family protein [Deltaproteobacteria bacterium]
MIKLNRLYEKSPKIFDSRRIFMLLLCLAVISLGLPGCAGWNHVSEEQLAISDVVVYPEIIYTGLHRIAYLDCGILAHPKSKASIHVDTPGSISLSRIYAYRSRNGQRRFCCKLDLPSRTAAGKYTVPIEITTENGKRAFTQTEIHIAPSDSHLEPKILCEQNQAMLDVISNSQVIDGNQVELLDKGPDAFKKWVAIIQNATATIYLQTYYLDDSGLSSQIVKILKDKAEQGIEVKVLLTRYSQLAKSPLTPLELRKHGVEVIVAGDIGFPRNARSRTLPWLEKMRRDYRIYSSMPDTAPFKKWIDDKGDDVFVDYALHEKMLVVDSSYAIVGGRNISDCYFWWWKDLDVLLEGPVVDEIGRAFASNWKDFGGIITDPTPTISRDGTTSVRTVQSKPWEGTYYTLDMLCSAINMAQSKLYITSQYLALPPKLNQALRDAALRGVDVRILTNSLETGEEVAFSLCHYISLNHYRELLKAGVRIYEYTGARQTSNFRPYLHSKQFIIDGYWLCIGSFNLSIRSSYLESEIMLNIHDKTLAEEQERKLSHQMMFESKEITPYQMAYAEDSYGLLMNMAEHLEILY